MSVVESFRVDGRERVIHYYTKLRRKVGQVSFESSIVCSRFWGLSVVNCFRALQVQSTKYAPEKMHFGLALFVRLTAS
jgi:hypothetical protein